MGLLDIKPFGDLEKYFQLIVLTVLTFVFTLGSVGGATLWETKSVIFSFGVGFFSACVSSATVGLESARRSKFFTKVADVAPATKPVEQEQVPVTKKEIKDAYTE